MTKEEITSEYGIEFGPTDTIGDIPHGTPRCALEWVESDNGWTLEVTDKCSSVTCPHWGTARCQ